MKNTFYFIKEAVRGFFQAKLMTSVSILTIAATLFFTGLIFIGYANVRKWLNTASKQAGAIVYLNDTYANDTALSDQLLEKMNALPQVSKITVVDRQEAWNRFEKLYGTEMLDAVDDNPFPASFEITVKDDYRSPEAVEGLKNELEQIDGVDGIAFSREWIEKLEKIRSWFVWGTPPVAAILFLALFFMISNTIKLTIYARKDLVTNMHFVGATEAYIKAPFILEGMLQGMLGGCIGIACLLAVKIMLSNLMIYWGPPYLLLIIFFIGVGFGWIGSWSATRKFLV